MLDKFCNDSSKQPTAAMTTPPNARNISCAEGNGLFFPLMKLSAEIRLEIYRHYLDGIYEYQIADRVNHWYRTCRRFLALQQSSSQVRREAAPIFYKETFGSKLHHWVLKTYNLQRWILRLQAMSQLLGQYNPDLQVSIECENTWVESPSRPFEILSFVNRRVWGFVNLQLPRSRREKRIRKLVSRECKSHSEEQVGFEETMGDFVVHYSSEPYSYWTEKLFIQGPLAKVDWSGLVF